MLLKEIKILSGKEIRLEIKQKYVLNGILLYLVSTILIAYLAFSRVIDPETWNSLFWIILLFVAVNSISKSFVQESPSRLIYYYTLSSPQGILLSKILYNGLLMILLAGLSSGLFILLMGNRILNFPLFLAVLFLGSIGLSSTLTMVAAIASRASNNFSLIAILSFPIILPLLLILVRVSSSALNTVGWAGNAGWLILLIMIDITVILLAFILFPYIWKE
ncbi:MAG: heme exporter protein CcmB [Bacteroidota bacterium]|nr:heme exporter protein CcmB [Bacteroidota bacterium]